MMTKEEFEKTCEFSLMLMYLNKFKALSKRYGNLPNHRPEIYSEMLEHVNEMQDAIEQEFGWCWYTGYIDN